MLKINFLCCCNRIKSFMSRKIEHCHKTVKLFYKLHITSGSKTQIIILFTSTEQIILRFILNKVYHSYQIIVNFLLIDKKIANTKRCVSEPTPKKRCFLVVLIRNTHASTRRHTRLISIWYYSSFKRKSKYITPFYFACLQF